MALFDRMTDGELDAEIESLAREIAELEDRHDSEEIDFNQWLTREELDGTIKSWEQAMAEKRRRIGFLVSPESF